MIYVKLYITFLQTLWRHKQRNENSQVVSIQKKTHTQRTNTFRIQNHTE